MIGRCCCNGSPCVGNNCCVETRSEENCGVAKATYTVNIGTAYCDCWTWGEYVVDGPGWRWCASGPPPFDCPDDYTEINDCPSQFLLKKEQCEAGQFQQHNVYTCAQSGDCADFNRGDATWNWPTGSVTAAFPLPLVGGTLLDPTGNCCIVMPDASGTITYTGFTGAANAAAGTVCYPYPALDPDDPATMTPPFAGAVLVQASFCACVDHPCIEWSPTEFLTEPMCTPCSGKWDVVTVAYFIRNEHQIQRYYNSSTGLCQDATNECWTYDTWTALVRYVRSPSCEESPRDIAGTYTFACAELFLPTTSVFYGPSDPFGDVRHQGGRGRRLAFNPGLGGDCDQSLCVWDNPEPICPTQFFVTGNMAKICAPDTKGYGWSFPATITIT